jgi:hypothetical protein
MSWYPPHTRGRYDDVVFALHQAFHDRGSDHLGCFVDGLVVALAAQTDDPDERRHLEDILENRPYIGLEWLPSDRPKQGSWNEYARSQLDALAYIVGGPKALLALDTEPLPDEPFDWTDVTPDLRERVGNILTLSDECCDAVFDVEHRTAARRLLHRVATRGSKGLRTKSRDESTAAAVVWAIGVANEAFQPEGPVTKKAVAEHFGLSGTGDRSALFRDAGMPHVWGREVTLGSPRYLVSKYRRRLVARREEFSEVLPLEPSGLRLV